VCLPTTPDIRRKTPERRTDKKADVLPELEVGAFEVKLLHYRCEDKTRDDLRRKSAAVALEAMNTEVRTGHKLSLKES
jgi:hypothetical protein